MKFPRGAKIFAGQFDPLPYVGVFLCLLIFFIFFQYMVLPRGIIVELPVVEGTQPVEPSRWRVVLDRNGIYYFEDRTWEPKKLELALSERIESLSNDSRVVTLEADKYVTIGQMNKAMMMLKSAGFSRVIQIARPPLKFDEQLIDGGNEVDQ